MIMENISKILKDQNTMKTDLESNLRKYDTKILDLENQTIQARRLLDEYILIN